jgi:ferritin-like metal-binding protein YciE
LPLLESNILNIINNIIMATATKKTPTKKSTTSAAKKSATKKVAAKSDAAKNLEDLYEDGLKDIYWAEKALLKALPKMEKNATDMGLKKGIAKHLNETEQHITRLETCFEELGMKPKAEKCDAMQGLIEEGESIMKETQVGAVRDAGIIAAAQKVEHYEIATYGTLAAYAKVLGYKTGLKQLLKTLGEEKQCDQDLTAMADTNLNSKANENEE